MYGITSPTINIKREREGERQKGREREREREQVIETAREKNWDDMKKKPNFYQIKLRMTKAIDDI